MNAAGKRLDSGDRAKAAEQKPAWLIGQARKRPECFAADWIEADRSIRFVGVNHEEVVAFEYLFELGHLFGGVAAGVVADQIQDFGTVHDGAEVGLEHARPRELAKGLLEQDIVFVEVRHQWMSQFLEAMPAHGQPGPVNAHD